MEHQESLQTGALIGQFANAIQHQINDLLADGVMAAGIVIGSILLAGDELFRVEQLTIGSGTDLICFVK